MTQAETIYQETPQAPPLRFGEGAGGRGSLPPLAVFDLDGTLVRDDSFLPFLISYAWRQRRIWPLLVLPVYLVLYACRILSDRKAKECVLISFLRGQSTRSVAEHAEWFCGWWVRHQLNAEVIA